MKRFPLYVALLMVGLLLGGASGCSSDPNVEGAKLDLRNKDYDRALENLEEAIARNPQNAEAYQLKGQVLLEQLSSINDAQAYQAKAQEMVSAFNQAAEIDPAMQETNNQYLRQAYVNVFNSGIQAFNRGRENPNAYADAATYFGVATEIMPDSAAGYVNQAFAYMNSGRQAEAVAPFERALALGDVDPQTYIYLSDLYRMQASELEEGTEKQELQMKMVNILEEARSAYPENADVQAQLLNAYIMADMEDRALQTYREAVEREPGNKLYQYNYGSLLLEAERYEEAIEHLRRAVELDPEYSNAYYNLGASYINMAVDESEEINALDDSLRANRSSLNQQQIREIETQIEQKTEQRQELFSEAIQPLERAKELTEAAGESASEICRALFSAYVQTGAQDKAESIAECAGYEDLN